MTETSVDTQIGSPRTMALNINKATRDALMTLPGISHARAAAILQLWESQNGFISKDDFQSMAKIPAIVAQPLIARGDIYFGSPLPCTSDDPGLFTTPRGDRTTADEQLLEPVLGLTTDQDQKADHDLNTSADDHVDPALLHINNLEQQL